MTVSNSHPSIWKLISVLKKEEALSQTKKLQFDRGDDFSGMSKKYKTINKRIKTAVERYNPEQKVLRGIAHNLHIF